MMFNSEHEAKGCHEGDVQQQTALMFTFSYLPGTCRFARGDNLAGTPIRNIILLALLLSLLIFEITH